MTSTKVDRDTAVVHHVLARIAEDLSTLLDRPFAVDAPAVRRMPHKIAGERTIHVAFKLSLTAEGRVHHGALLVPLHDAICMACHLLVMPDEIVAVRRRDLELDRATKDALVEIANLIGGSTDGAMRTVHDARVTARSEGCQGVRAGAAPAFERSPGAELLVARARAKLHTYPTFELPLMLPAIPPLPPLESAEAEPPPALPRG
jgi:hypothetical protein